MKKYLRSELDFELHKKLKIAAMQNNLTLSQAVLQAILEWVAKHG